jgi:hypothetical protein
MTLFFVFFGVMACTLFVLQAAIQRLEGRKEKPRAAFVKMLYTILFYGGALAVVAYPALFIPAIPRAISIIGGAVSYVFFLLLVHFTTAHKQEKEARRTTMLSLLRQQVRAKKLEKQVKDWNETYGM